MSRLAHRAAKNMIQQCLISDDTVLEDMEQAIPAPAPIRAPVGRPTVRLHVLPLHQPDPRGIMSDESSFAHMFRMGGAPIGFPPPPAPVGPSFAPGSRPRRQLVPSDPLLNPLDFYPHLPFGHDMYPQGDDGRHMAGGGPGSGSSHGQPP